MRRATAFGKQTVCIVSNPRGEVVRMDTWHLTIFPQGSLSASVITTVWVGVWVVTLLHVRLGWTFSGLVVPGYLAPLLIVKPWSAGVIFVEAVITYFVVWLISEHLGKLLKWSSLFGRDRFFIILLVSTVVRISCDVWLLPHIGQFVNEKFGLEFNYYHNLHSFGLIIVALVANSFWKSGLVRGIAPFFVNVFVTYLIVRFVLMVYTNFSIGNLQYTYSDIASSILASPRVYIILLTTAFIASWVNLKYGWEFSGIVIPALLALEWFEPWKIVTTFTEAGVILLVATLLLKAPWFRSRSFEGPQKILLFFNISFVWRIIVGYLVLWHFPYAKGTDFFGFGYLVSTLLAVKAHEKGIALRVLLTTVPVSFAGFVIGCSIGVLLTFLPNWEPDSAAKTAQAVAPVKNMAEPLRVLLQKEKVGLYKHQIQRDYVVAGPALLDNFRLGLGRLRAYMADRGRKEQLIAAADYLARAGFRVDEVQGRYLYLHEEGSARGRGIYVLDMDHPRGLAVEVPAPIGEWAVIETGGTVFQRLRGRSLAIAGRGVAMHIGSDADVRKNPRTVFQVFHDGMDGRNVLQVRGYTTGSLRSMFGQRVDPSRIGVPDVENSLWVKSSFPKGLDLSVLREMIGPFSIRWQAPPLDNVQRRSSSGGFAELFLNRKTRRAVIARSFAEWSPEGPGVGLKTREGEGDEWLLQAIGQIAEPGTNLYSKPTKSELLFFDEEVLVPLLKVMRLDWKNGKFSPEGIQELQSVAGNASALGYEVILYRDKLKGDDLLILRESAAAPQDRKYWGTYVFRLGKASPYIIQVPHPLFERNSGYFGATLFERLRASALFIAGASPDANTDGSADVVRKENKQNLFNLVYQTFLRENPDTPMMAVQSRVFGIQPELETPKDDALLALNDGANDPAALTPLARGIYETLREDNLRLKFVDGSLETTGYEAWRPFQSKYLAQANNKEFGIVWLSPTVRNQYQPHEEALPVTAQFDALDIKTIRTDLYAYLKSLEEKAKSAGGAKLPKDSPDLQKGIPKPLKRLLDEYVVTHDITILRQLLSHHPAERLEFVVDTRSHQGFLLVYTPGNRLPLVVNVLPRHPQDADVIVAGEDLRESVRHFIDSRCMWLVLEEKR